MSRTFTPYIVESFTMNFDTGEITDEVVKKYQPSVLPMDSVYPTGRILVMALRSRKMGAEQVVKGDILSIDRIHRSGQLVLRSRKGKLLPGLFPMDFVCEMLEVPNEPVQPPKGQNPKP